MAVNMNPTAPTPKSIGRQFINMYYKRLNESPESVHRFYKVPPASQPAPLRFSRCRFACREVCASHARSVASGRFQVVVVVVLLRSFF